MDNFLADIVEGLSQARSDVASLEALLAETPAGDEMAALAEEELKTAQERLAAFEHQAQRALLPKREEDDASAILEVRAGTGGEEAALFAGDLVRMYQRFASLKGWRFEVEDANETGLGGYKQLTATITGPGAYGVLRYESGVHRVQRVPETEAGGRVHTSAATVAVLPEPEDVAIEIDDKDEAVRARTAIIDYASVLTTTPSEANHRQWRNMEEHISSFRPGVWWLLARVHHHLLRNRPMRNILPVPETSLTAVDLDCRQDTSTWDKL